MYDEDKSGFISKIIGPKRAWRDYKARKAQLPGNYRIAIAAAFAAAIASFVLLIPLTRYEPASELQIARD